MENLQQILDGFLGFLQSPPDMIGRLWEWVVANATPIAAATGVLTLLVTLLLGIAGLKRRRKRKQKGVDTLIAVDMVSGSFRKLFSVACLVAGDGDFVPVVEEVKRNGIAVVVSAFSESLSKDLRKAADRVIELKIGSSWFRPIPLLLDDGRLNT